MQFALWTVLGFLIASVIILTGREALYRFFFSYPITTLSGQYAAHIESEDIIRWVAPLASGQAGRKDVCFVGNSHVMDAIDPAVVEKHTGLSCYNLALYAQCPFNLLLPLLRCARPPRHVFIDVSSRYSMISTNRDYVSLFDAWAAPSPERKDHIKRMERIDRLHTLLPSLFAPAPYRSMIKRVTMKLRKLHTTKRMYIGRYAPFKPFTNFQFRLDKATNHRAVLKVRKKSGHERAYERYLMRQCLRELTHLCPVGSPQYTQSMAYSETAIRMLRSKGINVTLMRLPLHPKIISQENRLCGRYFNDLQRICRRHGAGYLDFNGPEAATLHKHYEFYNDGHHVYQHSAEKISQYLAGMLIRCEKATAARESGITPKSHRGGDGPDLIADDSQPAGSATPDTRGT